MNMVIFSSHQSVQRVLTQTLYRHAKPHTSIMHTETHVLPLRPRHMQHVFSSIRAGWRDEARDWGKGKRMAIKWVYKLYVAACTIIGLHYQIQCVITVNMTRISLKKLRASAEKARSRAAALLLCMQLLCMCETCVVVRLFQSAHRGQIGKER